MTTIDQRILIPSPPEAVWEYLSDVRNIPRWQTDCTSVVFLTSKVSGPGTRWRQTIDKATEQVIEISAWYEGLGYQYTYVDGVPFREGTGRIRLQEIPEGTVVQWTITYEMGGLLGGVRSSLGLNRRLETMMVTSLKSLWRQVNDSAAAERGHEAKSLMRDAPNAEARANYRPRHASVVDMRGEAENENAEVMKPAASVEPIAEQDTDAKFRPPQGYVIPEPPVSDEDTRPRRAVEPPAPVEPPKARQTIRELVEDSEEPDFLDDMQRYAPPAEPPVDDTQPIQPVSAEPTEAPARDGFMDQFTLDDSDFAPQKPDAQPTPTDDATLIEEINSLVYQPESWEETSEGDDADEPIRLTDEIDALVRDEPQPTSVTDEMNALVAEPETPTAEELKSPSLTDEINALVAEADEPTPAISLTDEINALVVDPDVAAQAPSEPLPEDTLHKIDESSFPPPGATDTSKMSIWEIFGVPRPSETTEVEAVEASEPDAEAVETPDAEDSVTAEATHGEPEAVEAPAASEVEVESEAEEAPVAAAEPTPEEPTVAEASADAVPMPDMAVSTGELTIVEVIREVAGPPRRTGLRARMRQKARRVRTPD